MATLNVNVRYRPLRIGWCVRNDDWVAFRKAVRWNYVFWGGCYNPIIPVDNIELARNLVKVFRLDMLASVTTDQILEKFSEEFAHLKNPLYTPIFTQSNRGGHCAVLDVRHAFEKLYKEEYRNNAHPKYTVAQYEWQKDDPLADIFLCGLGQFPPADEVGIDYLALLKQAVPIREQACKIDADAPWLGDNVLPLSWFSSAYLTPHYTVRNYWNHPGFYVGSVKNFADLINYWNLRAAGIAVTFFDPEHEKRLESRRTKLIEQISALPARHPESNSKVPVTIWRGAGDQKIELGKFGKHRTASNLSEHTWNGRNIRPDYMHFGESSVLADVGKSFSGKTTVTFSLRDKPFSDDAEHFGQHVVASIDPGTGLMLNERETLWTPYLPELNNFYGRECYFETTKARVEPRGLGVITTATTNHLSLAALGNVELIGQIFDSAGIEAKLSKPGLVAARLIHQMGGVQGCRAFAVEGVRKLIEKYRPDQKFTRGGATELIFGGSNSRPLSSYADLHIKGRGVDSGLSAHSIFDRLLDHGIFRAGLEFTCPNCELEFWTSLDDARSRAVCEYCGHDFNVAPFLKDRDWAYRRSGLFGRDDNQAGSIPVAMVLRLLDSTFWSSKLVYSTAMELRQKTSGKCCETDFIAIAPPDRQGRLEIVIGECKTRQEISPKDVENLKLIADSFSKERFAVYIVFAKLDAFTNAELLAIGTLNGEFETRAIVLSTEELERYRAFDDMNPNSDRRRSVSDLSDMANVTLEIYGERFRASMST